jgi:hypothetical protein
MSLGQTEEQATKLLLFVPCAFAREMFEPEGVQFSDYYLRSNDGCATNRRKSYLREPIYQWARAVARQFIEQERFTDLRIVIAWSAEGNLVQQAIERGCLLNSVKMAEPTHYF